MPIVYENVPASALDALDAGQGLLAAGEANLKAMLQDARLNTQAHQPHRMMSFSLEHLDQPDPQQFFAETGWRYIGAHDGVDYSVEVHSDATAQQHRFAMINFGPYIEATRKGLAQAAQHPDILAHPYHFVLLHVLDVPLIALYFYPQADAPAYAMVLSPLSVNPAQQHHVISRSDLFALLKKEAGSGP